MGAGRLVVVAVMWVLACTPAALAATTPELIDADLAAGRISETDANLYRSYALYDYEQLPTAYRSVEPWEGTEVYQQVKAAGLAPRQTRHAGGDTCAGRPPTNDPTPTLSDHFYIEFPGFLGNGHTEQDYVDVLEHVYDVQVEDFGWVAAPLSSSPAAPGRFPVYVQSLGGGLAGLVAAGSGAGTHAEFLGDNPATPWQEDTSLAGCMLLDSSLTPPFLRTVTAHEYHHAIQFGHGAFNSPPVGANSTVVNEAGATWMEDEVYDADNTAYSDLYPNFADSLLPHSTTGSEEYFAWFLLRLLTDRFGNAIAGGGEQVMQDFWELQAGRSGAPVERLAALDQALGLAQPMLTLGQAHHDGAVAAWFMLACTVAIQPHCLDEGPAIVAQRGYPSAHHSTALGATTNASVESNYATKWVVLPTTGTYSVTVTNTEPATHTIKATVACSTGPAHLARVSLGTLAPGDAATAPNVSGCPRAVAVITSSTRVADDPTTSEDVSFSVQTTPTPPASYDLTVGLTGTGTGAVSSNPTGISCGADCSQTYTEGTNVTLTATPDAGSAFGSWSGACAGWDPLESTCRHASLSIL